MHVRNSKACEHIQNIKNKKVRVKQKQIKLEDKVEKLP